MTAFFHILRIIPSHARVHVPEQLKRPKHLAITYYSHFSFYKEFKMSRLLILLSLFIYFSGMVGCSTIISKQEWSENYALADSVKSTSPEMIDGNLKTLGTTAFPASAQNVYGASPASEVVITLPKKKKIRRIVIHWENLKTFDVFAD